jgi:phosphodiesterase/alkaline phosphatase D-like protein
LPIVKHRLVCIAAVLAVTGFVLPGSAAAKGGFSSGVTAGDVSSSSARLWTRAPRPGAVVLLVSKSRRALRCKAPSRRTLLLHPPAPVRRKVLAASPANDLTAQTRITRLRSRTRYSYRFCQGSAKSSVGRFKTAPSRRSGRRITFGVTGDADGALNPATGQPAYNRFEVYGRMAREHNDFNVNLGDVIYSDSAVPGVPVALTLPDKWAKYRLNLSYPNLRAVRAQTGLYNLWDDHEFIDDFSIAQYGLPLYQSGKKAFLDYSPARFSSKYGLYHSYRWGKNLEVFFLDERSFRSKPAEAEPACRNPATGQPDPLPQLPARLRSQLIPEPAFANFPNAAQCQAILNDPNRTMLGKPQLAHFEAAIKRSKATFKVIMNEIPMQKMYFVPYDRWEGYNAEREALLTFLQQNVKNVVFLTTDLHATLINDVRLANFPEEGVSKDTGMLDFVTGPVAKNTFGTDANAKLGNPGAEQAVWTLFKTPRPVGLGMRCASLDGDSYVHVAVTSKALTVSPLDQNGDLVRENDGRQCVPIPIPAR